MKRIFLAAVALGSITSTVLAQHDHSGHTNKTPKNEEVATSTVALHVEQQLTQLLSFYYNLKNALVVGDPSSASSNAALFVKTVNTVDYKLISEGNIHILGKDAGRISDTNDLEKQRQYFIALSSNMIPVAKRFKAVYRPIYVQYCPMKKASWLSADKDIRNPYYGSEMLTCGEVKETF